MKTINTVSILALSLLAGNTQEIRVGDQITVQTSDIRVVDGYRIDLAPLHRWLRNPQGQRPLRAWKQIQIFNIKGRVSSYDLCVIKDEAGDFREIYIARLPAEIGGMLLALKDYEAKIENLTRQLALEKPAAERAAATAPIWFEDSLDIVERMNERYAANLAMLSVKEKEETLAKWQAEYARLKDDAQTRTKVLAAFAGKKYGQVEVADCGTPVSP